MLGVRGESRLTTLDMGGPDDGPDCDPCELFEELTGLSLRVHTGHEVPQAVAGGLTVLDVAPSREEIVAKIAAVAAGQTWRPMLVLAVDGADVQTRPETAKGHRPGRKVRAKRARWTGKWREAKGFRCSLLADDRIVQVLSWHQIQTDEEAAAALRQVHAARLIPEAQVCLCRMADGVRWIWQQAQALFPSAVEMLDDSMVVGICTRWRRGSMVRIPSGNTNGARLPWAGCCMGKCTGSSGACSG